MPLPLSLPAPALGRLKVLPAWDSAAASLALLLMLAIPVIEVALRPLRGQGIENASVLVQHLGLVLAMFGAVVAERGGHLATLGPAHDPASGGRAAVLSRRIGKGGAAVVCGLLALASWRFVASEAPAATPLAYGIPVWWVQAVMPLGFLLLGMQLGSRCAASIPGRVACAIALPLVGAALAQRFDGTPLPLWPALAGLLLIMVAGAPIFAVLGGLALALFWHDGLPLASVSLSQYQITVNPSLPALPLFTLAGLLFARTGAAQRLSGLFLSVFGGRSTGTVLATAVLCTAFTAFTGGSGVTVLALGGLLLPLLRHAGYPEQRGIGLVTSASALGVLLAPSVPLIMFAVIARVPIADMFLAGVLPAIVMVVCLLTFGGFLRRAAPSSAVGSEEHLAQVGLARIAAAAWQAKWEILAPVVAIGSLVSGLATPTESAAITTAYALATQAFAHRELTWRLLGRCLADCTQLIGGVMLVLGMALALTNYLVDAGVPDAAVEWTRHAIPGKYAFLLALCLFLAVAAALMEIFAAIVVLVPLLLPVARAYGVDPVHFGIIFLAAMELGFLCPPAGMNLYFASAMFDKPMRYVAASVLPAVLAIFIGTMVIACVPVLATGLPQWLGRH